MFVTVDTLVYVTEGSLAGRFGKVSSFLLDDDTGDTMVLVDVFDHGTGAFPKHMLRPDQIKGRPFDEGLLLRFMEMQDEAQGILI